MRMIESINVAMTPRQPAGMTPSALALERRPVALICRLLGCERGGGRRYRGRSKQGAWLRPDGLVSDRRAFAQRWATDRYQWARHTELSQRQGDAVCADGRRASSHRRRFNDDELDAYTKTVLSNSPYRDEKLDRVFNPEGNPVPARPGDPSPIQHVLYIVKENRTYDQVLGDLGKGNGDPSLTTVR